MKYRKIFLIILIGFLPIALSSCRTSQAQKQQKGIEKRKAERKKETEQLYEEALKRHHDIQTKETRKRMKQTQKKAKRINKPKEKKFFLFRWFSKKECLD